jgi:hypothetical protein
MRALKMTNEILELLLVIEDLRSERYSDIPADLVEKVLGLEVEQLGNRSRIIRNLDNIISEYLSEEDS